MTAGEMPSVNEPYVPGGWRIEPVIYVGERECADQIVNAVRRIVAQHGGIMPSVGRYRIDAYKRMPADDGPHGGELT